jgi:hypothetical protein
MLEVHLSEIAKAKGAPSKVKDFPPCVRISSESFSSVMSRSFLLFTALFLAGCVTTPTSKKKFDPWEAAHRADESVDVWLEKHSGFERRNPRMWND